MMTMIFNLGLSFFIIPAMIFQISVLLIVIQMQTVFSGYLDRTVHFMELPGDIPNRQVVSLSLFL